jgi:AraC-like DNA-binding protein
MNLLLEFKILNVPAKKIKQTYEIPHPYNRHIWAFSRPFLMTSPPVDILYQQRSINDCMINNITFFVRHNASLSSINQETEVAFYCMITGNTFLNTRRKKFTWLYEGQYTYVNDNKIPLLLDLEPGIYELHLYGYAKKALASLSEELVRLSASRISITFPRTISIPLHQVIREVKLTYVHASLRDAWLDMKLREALLLFVDDFISPRKNAEAEPDTTMNTILGFINDNLDNEISISQLTKMYYVSDSTIRRNFIRKFGITFSQYLQKTRLEKAEKLLYQTNRPIQDIALQVGYKSAAAFAHAFKQHFGYTPTSTREISV